MLTKAKYSTLRQTFGLKAENKIMPVLWGQNVCLSVEHLALVNIIAVSSLQMVFSYILVEATWLQIYMRQTI